ncbi:hypothetical protein ACJJIU_09435 [Microbulbifer sp. CnH-101-E]|uniref:hypothetical protein n=1 Tax=unclassified Microbulbifer TaxID=2619833 RepID=UPI00403900D0
MNKSIRSFSKHKTALTTALLLALFSLIFVIPMSLVFLTAPMIDAEGNPVKFSIPGAMVLGMPFIYLIFGYLSTLLFTALYNVVARFTGGITFTLEDANS